MPKNTTYNFPYTDGNLHIHITKEEGKTEEYVKKLRNEIYEATANLGGVITGEHGIGRLRLDCISYSIDEKQLDLVKRIKKMFDPNNILNPGVKVPI